MSAPLRPVILSGGSGTRLWPTSRASMPKQLLPLVSQRTMLQETALRFSDADPDCLDPIVICNEAHRFLIASQLQEVGMTPCATVLEPLGRNTAPAAAIASILSLAGGEDEILLILPADHHIEDVPAFMTAVWEGVEMAKQGKIVTFGIRPDKAETGYGYIQAGKPIDPREQFFEVDRFIEKPDQATAERLIEDTRYLWNSGIVMFAPSTFMAELEEFAPEIPEACSASIVDAIEETDFFRLKRDVFATCPSASIDHAVLEHSDKVVVIPVDMGWSDVGSWSALWEIAEKDSQGNATTGDVMIEDSENCLLRSDGKLISAIGLTDLVLIETDDAILAAHKSRVQDVKGMVERLRKTERKEGEHHRKVHRPWGWYDCLQSGPGFQVKMINVEPGESLSLQYHHHRSENWIVVEGEAEVTVGNQLRTLGPNDSIAIPAGTRHRLENLGRRALKLIEVQSGAYLGEDDIVRLEDVYDRV